MVDGSALRGRSVNQRGLDPTYRALPSLSSGSTGVSLSRRGPRFFLVDYHLLVSARLKPLLQGIIGMS